MRVSVLNGPVTVTPLPQPNENEKNGSPLPANIDQHVATIG